MVELAGVTASNPCLHLFWKLNLVFHLSFRHVNITVLFLSFKGLRGETCGVVGRLLAVPSCSSHL